MEYKPNSIFEAAKQVLTEAKAAYKTDPEILADYNVSITFKQGSLDMTYELDGKKKKVTVPHDKFYSAEYFLFNLVNVIEKDLKASQGITNKSYGQTHVNETPKQLVISHNGNMGSSLRDIDNNLKELGYPPITQLKKKYPKKIKETGSPDYSYSLVLNK